MKYKISVRRLPTSDKKYHKATFFKSQKHVEFIKDRDDCVLLNGDRFWINDAFELADALITGEYERRVEFYRYDPYPVRYELSGIDRQPQVTENIHTTDINIKYLILDEINAILSYNIGKRWISVDNIIKGLSRKLNLPIEKLNKIYDGI